MTLASFAAVLSLESSLGAQAPRASGAVVPVCLPPRATSCEPREKKQAPEPSPAAPVLRAGWVTLVNLHTREALAVDPLRAGADVTLARLLRDRTNWETHAIAGSTWRALLDACAVFAARRVELVSGYRSDKLNESLRKKGRHVAAHSQHTLGSAIDFRLVGVPDPLLFRWARAVHEGGVGVYPRSHFVHLDAGARRRWRGE